MKVTPVTAICFLLFPLGYILAPAQQQTNLSSSLINLKPTCGVTITGPSWIRVNDNDDNNNEIWDWNELTDSNDCEPVIGEQDTDKITVTATSPGTCTGTVVFAVSVFGTGLDRIDGFWPGLLEIRDTAGNLLHAEGNDTAAKEKRVAKQYPAHFAVEPGQSVTVHLWFEGIHHSAAGPDPDVVIEAKSSSFVCGEHGAKDAQHKLSVYQADLDIDSNNNEGTTFTEGSPEEDQIEASVLPYGNWPKRPGKLIMANDGFGDDIPDWADGFISDVYSPATYACGPPITFIPILLERKPPFTSNCTVNFTYSASDPSAVSTTPGNGFPAYDKQFIKPSNKLIRIWKVNNDGTTRNDSSVIYDGDYVKDGIEIPWTKLSDGLIAHLWVEAVDPSSGLADISIKARIKEGIPEVDDEIRMTALKITCEPITTEPNQGLYPYNPAGVVAMEDAIFKIDVEPEEFPDAEVKWHTEMWAALTQIPKVGTTRKVTFRHGATWATGTVRADVTGNYYTSPIFPLNVFASWSDIHLNAFVVPSDGSYSTAPGDPAVSDADLTVIISRLNEIHRQAGMRYSYSRTLLPLTDNGYFICDATEQYSLVDKPRNGISGLEVYFVGGSSGWNGVDMRPVRPFETSHGIIINSILSNLSPSQLGKTLAHEIGHTCSLDDIYDQKTEYDSNNNPVDFKELGPYAAKHDWSSSDWPAEAAFASDPSYYKRLVNGYNASIDLDAYATRQVTLIKRLMMYGYSNPSDPLDTKKLDIPRGLVYGIEGGYGQNFPLNKTHVVVGLSNMNRFPIHQ